MKGVTTMSGVRQVSVKSSSVYRIARDIIARQNQWTRGTFARTVAGVRCSPHDENATSWDMLGAIKYALFRTGAQHVEMSYLWRITGVSNKREACKYNDHQSRSAIVACLEFAADMAQAKGD